MRQGRLTVVLLAVLVAGAGCATREMRRMEATGYCGCGQCCGWERGSWTYLKLDFWNRYVNVGSRAGAEYTGHTASGTRPREPHPGLLSVDTIQRPWVLPFRVLFPWLWVAHDGTIAADTRYYRFGTRMYVPGWGWGTVEDRGSAIKGPRRIDLYFDDHDDALEWGRRNVEVRIER